MKDGVASLERKVYWRLILPGEVIQHGDQFCTSKGWYNTRIEGIVYLQGLLYRRKVKVS